MFDASTGGLLRRLVDRRVSFLVTGGTGSGKTTLLGALLAEVPCDERVVLVEDVRELSVAHPHVVRLQSRSANVEGVGEVTLVDLVRQALRMRPDRLVVGEVRGAEVRELLSALNTGHDGGGGTVHANSPADVVPRFEALGALAGLGREAVQAQLASAVQAVVHLRRERAGRRIASLSVLQRRGAGMAAGLGASVAVECAPAPGSGTGAVRGPGWPVLAALLGVPA
jgi:pilus assembly protein CpaF